MSKIIFTIDVEPDLHTNSYLGVVNGLKKAEEIFDSKIKPVLFVTCDCLVKYPEIFRKLQGKGWEISLHGYKHKRFDEMHGKEKEEHIEKSIKCFKKHLKIKPRGFRAPQHSINSETLNLLEKYNFEYDSSFAPLNFFQLFFFPSKFKLWLKHFFSPLNPYLIKPNLEEKPTSSLFLPFTSLTVRILPLPILKLYILLIKIIYKKPVFYCHSWDFIRVDSKIDRIFPSRIFQRKLRAIIR